ncbi:MAG: exonuclease SbcCD subunit D [Planctomycetota bacterium]
MRFLHTADWHLGKKLRLRSRLPEQRAALQQLGDAAIEHAVDAVLIAGDVYESTMPPPEAEQVAFEFLARLSQAGIPSVVIAGNHDQPQRLQALRPLLESLHIHVRAEVRAPQDGGVVELRSRDGRERALVAALPFVPERKVLDAELVARGTDEGHVRYADRIARVLERFDAAFGDDTVNVLLAHLLITGARFGTGERQLHLGEIFAIHPEQLPAKAHYAALGHLHRPQELPGARCRAAYAGSLVELDFGEREQQKRAVLVEAHPGAPAQLTDVPLTAGRRLLDVTGTLASLDQQKDRLGDAFLRVTVQVPEPTPGIEDKVRALLPCAVEVRQDWPRDPADVAADAADPADAPQDPAALFAEFHRREQGTAPPAAMAALFAELYAEARGDRDDGDGEDREDREDRDA